jgi:signal transduction histidine kinase
MLSALRTESPDVLILDLDLGGVSGLTVLEQLAQPSGESPFPVVVLSGANSDTEAVASLKAGAHDYVSKDRLTGALMQKAVQYARDSFRLQTELKARQRELEQLNRELRQKDRAKLLFVASASHELRTPVAGMMGLLSLLRNSHLDEEQEALVSSLNSCCHSLLICVDDVIDMAKIEAGQLEIRKLPFALAQQVSCSLEPLRILAIDKGLELSCEFGDNLPEYVTGDPGRLRQLLNNLVGNAIKFTLEGSVKVRVTRADRITRFEVIDTGVGVDPHDLERLFEAHFQAGSRDSRSLGSGLGLTITANITRFMGGRIGVNSRLGEGSTFWIEIPLPEASDVASVSKMSQIAAPIERNLKLLVAEDNPIVSRVLKAQLTDLGHDVTLVRDGLDAVKACGDEQFDAVVMDCQMPQVDGYEATRSIRLLPGYATVPVIALTAQAFTGEKEKCLAAGMTDYLVKPVTPAELQNCLHLHTGELEPETGSLPQDRPETDRAGQTS